MAFFDKNKKQAPTRDFWKEVEKDKGIIPGTGGRVRWSRLKRRKEIRKELPRFGKQGSIVQKWEFDRVLRKLDSERTAKKRAGDRKGAREIQGKLRYLSKFGSTRLSDRISKRKSW